MGNFTEFLKAKTSYESGKIDGEFLYKQIIDYKKSQAYQDMIDSFNYYQNEQKIKEKERKGIGKNGTSEVIKNIPNNRILDNRYSMLVDQKKNYLLSRPFIVNTENEDYLKEISKFFNYKFHKKLKTIGLHSFLAPHAFIYPYMIDGEFKIDIFDPREILVFWKEKSHENVESFVRFYKIIDVSDGTEKEIEVFEYYTLNGIDYYAVVNGKPKFISRQEGYIDNNGEPWTWGKIPLVYFKRNDLEMPLLNNIRSLQDAINEILSKFVDDMQEDSRNTIIVLKNVGGEQDLGKLRSKINQAGIMSLTGNDTGIETISIDVNSENYQVVLDILRKTILDNGRGVDTKSDVFKSAPNQMTIQSMYSDMDLDADDMEMEFKLGLDRLLYFFNETYDYEYNELVEFNFDRNILINETIAIENAQKSKGLISDRKIVENHPWTTNVDDELKQMAEERKQDLDYNTAWNRVGDLNE